MADFYVDKICLFLKYAACILTQCPNHKTICLVTRFK